MIRSKILSFFLISLVGVFVTACSIQITEPGVLPLGSYPAAVYDIHQSNSDSGTLLYTVIADPNSDGEYEVYVVEDPENFRIRYDAQDNSPWVEVEQVGDNTKTVIHLSPLP
jgi:hypothetical protein